MGREFSTTLATSRSSNEVSFADTVFGFWDSSNSSNDRDVDDDDDDENICTTENNKAFWVEQDQLLKGILCRTSSREIKVRQATKELLRELNMSEMLCVCRPPVVAKSCRNCLLRELCDRLLNLGYNCAICKSKWKSTSEIPSGEHTYLEVTDNLSNTKSGAVKVVIELSFRAEFEMARANEEYNQLIRRLPEVYVGKAERLRALVKIMCSAAKKCMKEKKMHIGPWRKHEYMQAKWFGTSERSTVEPLPTVYPTRQPNLRLQCSVLIY
ncbi:hypothetical protein E2542_SST30722 [Spatholobus suberectus]|nr:hypothetical protein E2542_SST30722 [Spatholobus suberectus]